MKEYQNSLDILTVNEFFVKFIKRSEYFNEFFPIDSIERKQSRYYAKIKINSFEECYAPIAELWTQYDYKNQWKEGLKKVLCDGSTTSAIVKSFPLLNDDRNTLHYFGIWIDGDEAYIQSEWRLLRNINFKDENVLIKSMYECVANGEYDLKLEGHIGSRTSVQALRNFFLEMN